MDYVHYIHFVGLFVINMSLFLPNPNISQNQDGIKREIDAGQSIVRQQIIKTVKTSNRFEILYIFQRI